MNRGDFHSMKNHRSLKTMFCSGLGIGLGIVLWIAISTYIFVYSVGFTKTVLHKKGLTQTA